METHEYEPYCCDECRVRCGKFLGNAASNHASLPPSIAIAAAQKNVQCKDCMSEIASFDGPLSATSSQFNRKGTPRLHDKRASFRGRSSVHVPPTIEMIVDLGSGPDHAPVQEHVECCVLKLLI